MPRRNRIGQQTDESFAVIGFLLTIGLALAAAVAFTIEREGWAFGFFVAGLCTAVIGDEKSNGCIMLVLTLFFSFVLLILSSALESFLGLF